MTAMVDTIKKLGIRWRCGRLPSSRPHCTHITAAAGCVDDVIFAHNRPHGYRHVDTAAASDVLRLGAQANALAASYRLRRILDDDRRRDYRRVRREKVAGSKACNAPL